MDEKNELRLNIDHLVEKIKNSPMMTQQYKENFLHEIFYWLGRMEDPRLVFTGYKTLEFTEESDRVSVRYCHTINAAPDLGLRQYTVCLQQSPFSFQRQDLAFMVRDYLLEHYQHDPDLGTLSGEVEFEFCFPQ